MDDYSAKLLSVTADVFDIWAEALMERTLISSTPPKHMSGELRAAAISTARSHALQGLRDLLELDVLQQRLNPLAILRSATQPLTQALSDAGASEVHRDEFHVRSFPDDVYGLAPATWADIDVRLVEPGIEWGAWKAASVISRRRHM